MLLSFTIEQIQRHLEQEFWGYKVEYYPKYKDYVVSVKKTRVPQIFLGVFTRYIIAKEEIIISKEEMNWNEMTVGMESPLFHTSWNERMFIYKNNEHKVILFR